MPVQGERYVISTHFPAALAAPGTPFTLRSEIRAPIVVRDAGHLDKLVQVDRRNSTSMRFYLAEFLGEGKYGAEFRPVRRLRISNLDLDEAPEGPECPEREEVEAFLVGDLDLLGPSTVPAL